MQPLFHNRIDAGQRLGERLSHLAGLPRLLILGLPRGGVPVAWEVAKTLGAPLDVFLVRKLGVPGHEELAMGAVASGGVQVLNADVLNSLAITRDTLDQVAEREKRELERRTLIYRGNRPFPDLRYGNVVLVDDGVATGSTMLAAIRSVRKGHPDLLVVAAPVMSEEAADLLGREADSCITLATPEPFGGVGAWYEDFSQTSDAEVVQILAEAGRAAVRPTGESAGRHANAV